MSHTSNRWDIGNHFGKARQSIMTSVSSDVNMTAFEPVLAACSAKANECVVLLVCQCHWFLFCSECNWLRAVPIVTNNDGCAVVRYLAVVAAVADHGASGPWGPQFCGALCKGVTQRLPAGGLGRCKPLAGSGAEPRSQTHFRNNY